MTKLQQIGYATLVSQAGSDLITFGWNVIASFYTVSYVRTLPLPCHAGSVAFCIEELPVTCFCAMDSDSPAVPHHLIGVD